MPKEKIKQLQAQKQKDMQKIILKWDTALYTQYQKTKLWYIVVGLISAFTVIYSFLTGSWSFALSLSVITLIYFHLNRKEVPHTEAIITPRGVYFANKFYYFKDIQYFWIEEHLPTFQALHLHVANQRHSQITIQFYDFTADYLSNVLRHFIPEDTHRTPSILEHFIHILKL